MQTIARFERRCLYHGYEMPAEFENLAGAASLMLGYPAEAKERFRRALGKNPELISARRNLELPEGPPTNVAGAEAITGDSLRRR
jgi:hypothetical protein